MQHNLKNRHYAVNPWPMYMLVHRRTQDFTMEGLWGPGLGVWGTEVPQWGPGAMPR